MNNNIQSFVGILIVISFTLLQFNGENFVLSFGGAGNIEIEQAELIDLANDNDQNNFSEISSVPHQHIVISHLNILEEPSSCSPEVPLTVVSQKISFPSLFVSSKYVVSSPDFLPPHLSNLSSIVLVI